MKQRILQAMALVAVGFCFDLGAHASGLVFNDDFNRPDSPAVGNGWIDASSNPPGKSLVVAGNRLSAVADGGSCAIYRDFPFTRQIELRATFTDKNGYGCLRMAHSVAFGIKYGGNTESGYRVSFSRSDQNYNNSSIQLIDNGVEVGSITPSFQFGYTVTIDYLRFDPDGSVFGRISGDGATFDFSFGPRTINSSGSNVCIYIGSADNRCGSQTQSTVDNFEILQTAPPAIASQPQSQTVQTGANATFSVSATNASGVKYQWRLNGQNIASATNASLTLNAVTAANSGGYSVFVSSGAGSVVSVTASLAVLADGANGSQPQQPVYPALPPAETGKDSLVFITHGRTPPSDSGDHPWVDDMKTAIKAQVPANWMVIGYKWPDESRASIFTVISNARDVGRKVGRSIMELAQLTPNQRWEHVHLIAHSAGSRLIEEASKIIHAESPTTTIHTTFLDAYTGVTDNGSSQYGSVSDWADSYFAVDTETHDQTVGRTEGPLDHARNVDITWLDSNKSVAPIYCASSSSTAGSTPPTLDQICGYQATSVHRWPYDFYYQTILGTASACATGYGFPRSKEGSGWNNRGSYPVGNQPTALCGSTLAQNTSPFNLNGNLPISALPYGTSADGVSFSGVGFSLTTHSPTWLAVGVAATNTVNFIQFDAGFTSTNGAAGLLTVYWNTNEIGSLDERVALSGMETYRFSLPAMSANGIYTLSFRLDPFTNVTSSVVVTNVKTGFSGVEQPIRLDMSLSASNNTPLLMLSGATNYNYIVESSTNLTDWTPTALLVNTNGTVFFADPAVTNFSRRFYRATMP